MSSGPLINVNIGDLSKPATVLIEKISDAVGSILKPYQIVRLAKAEPEAARIRAESEVQISELQQRALHRFLQEEAMKQANIEEITLKALPLLEENSRPDALERDWIANFFDKSRIISDSDMQVLWARILAGESNAPGSFSRKTINLLSDLDTRDALLFRSLCGFIWTIGGYPAPLIFAPDSSIYNDQDINFGSLIHLETLGLIQFDALAGFRRTRLSKTLTAVYFGRSVLLKLPKDDKNTLDIGKVVLTRPGLELAGISGALPVQGFFEFVYSRWAEQSPVQEQTAQ